MLNHLMLSIRTTFYNRTFKRLIHGPKPNCLFGEVLTVKSYYTKRCYANDSVAKPDAFYQEIYRFPAIRVGHVLQKLKWYQSLLTAAAVPTAGLLCFGGLIESIWIFNVLFSGLLVTSNLYVYATFFNEAIGFMYLSKDKTTVKISYLDYWGRRVDKVCPVEDVVPLSDAPGGLTDRLFKKIVFYSDNKLKLKLYFVQAKITDKDGFIKVFGTTKNN